MRVGVVCRRHCRTARRARCPQTTQASRLTVRGTGGADGLQSRHPQGCAPPGGSAFSGFSKPPASSAQGRPQVQRPQEHPPSDSGRLPLRKTPVIALGGTHGTPGNPSLSSFTEPHLQHPFGHGRTSSQVPGRRTHIFGEALFCLHIILPCVYPSAHAFADLRPSCPLFARLSTQPASQPSSFHPSLNSPLHFPSPAHLLAQHPSSRPSVRLCTWGRMLREEDQRVTVGVGGTGRARSARLSLPLPHGSFLRHAAVTTPRGRAASSVQSRALESRGAQPTLLVPGPGPMEPGCLLCGLRPGVSPRGFGGSQCPAGQTAAGTQGRVGPSDPHVLPLCPS